MRDSYITQREGKPVDHYELTCENWRNKFLEMDQEELIRRFSLEADEKALYIPYFSQIYRIDRTTGMTTLTDDPEKRLKFNTIITIYNLFYYAKPQAKVCGTFVPFRHVKRAAPFDPTFQRTILKPLAQTFNGHIQELEKACLALHGTPISQGDVGYVIHAFPWMPLTVIFWDGDEEFDAQANMLFDAEITNFLHEETVVCVASDFARRLGEESGIGNIDHLMGGDIR